MNPLLRLVPPLWFFTLLGTGLLVHFFVPAARIFEFGDMIIGIGLIVFGLVISNYSSSLFSKEKTEILPTSETNRTLITYGPYNWTRNPMYLGMVAMLFGAAVWVGTLPLYVAVVIYFCVLNFAFVPFEEAKLHRIFGDQYAAYRRTVRRWL
jgi:protein-S-isoprenylcysteine O-methyltransferase Ste14